MTKCINGRLVQVNQTKVPNIKIRKINDKIVIYQRSKITGRNEYICVTKSALHKFIHILNKQREDGSS